MKLKTLPFSPFSVTSRVFRSIACTTAVAVTVFESAYFGSSFDVAQLSARASTVRTTGRVTDRRRAFMASSRSPPGGTNAASMSASLAMAPEDHVARTAALTDWRTIVTPLLAPQRGLAPPGTWFLALRDGAEAAQQPLAHVE